MISRERADSTHFIPVWVRNEHLARYEFASSFVFGKTVLDCACGDGRSSVMFAKAGALHVYARDSSEESIQHAKDSLADEKIDFEVADARQICLPDSSIDVYVSLETIEHIEQDREYLVEAARLLRDDGVFICSTPNRTVTNPGKRYESKPFNVYHIREYSRQEFVNLLTEYFTNVEVFGQNPAWRFSVRVMGFLGRILPFNGAARLRQMMKLPRLLYDRKSHHFVRNETTQVFEYLVAVCRNPKRNKVGR